jgi:hypothetical protein
MSLSRARRCRRRALHRAVPSGTALLRKCAPPPAIRLPSTALAYTYTHAGLIPVRRTYSQVTVEYAAEVAKEKMMIEAGEKSEDEKKKLLRANLEHADGHLNVRWKSRGIPPARVAKKDVYLELLHSIPINAMKLQVKHATFKYMPEAMREEGEKLFKLWGIPIDTRKKGKRTEEKWPGTSALARTRTRTCTQTRTRSPLPSPSHSPAPARWRHGQVPRRGRQR